jgi:hypothetical protein
MLFGLLGNKVSGLLSVISNFAGVKQSSVSSILSAVVPVALGFSRKAGIKAIIFHLTTAELA